MTSITNARTTTGAPVRPAVLVEDGQLIIDGRPRLVLVSSLFYFRIPRELWRERISAVKAAGYHAIDVYLPWNHHELAPGQWDFSGERDVDAFLRLAAEEGLWVIARPGPYICSEWDGGGLPAWLGATLGLRLRDNNDAYLSEVERWFTRALPIIRRHQLGDGGTVIAVQLENELDFFDSVDPDGYLAALRALAREHGITVPLIVCAGQGDLVRAGGELPELLPTCNFYPDDRSAEIESVAEVYQRALAERGLPLLITETNRRHTTLRRFLSTGARLLSPYLQVSGTNFGFTNAVNNWGSPIAFLANDYDLDGMLAPDGRRRPEYGEGRLLSGLINTLGESLAAARPVSLTQAGLAVETDFALPSGGARALQLAGGGALLVLANTGEAAGSASVRSGDGPPLRRTVNPGECPLLPIGLPLSRWGVEATVTATAELLAIDSDDQVTTLVWYGDKGAEVRLAANGPAGDGPAGDGATDDGWTVRLTGESHEATLDIDGRQVRLVLLGRDEAARLERLTAEGEPVLAPVEAPATAYPGADLTLTAAPSPEVPGDDGSATQWPHGPPRLEQAGIYRGFGWYRAVAPPNVGLLLHGAADIVSARVGDQYLGTVSPGGGHALLPGTAGGEVTLRAEIWGHCNFDDSRLPALRLGSLRGVSAVTAVSRILPLEYFRLTGPGVGAAPPPMIAWGNWITGHQPEYGVYRTSVRLAADADSWTLTFDGLAAQVLVRVNGQALGEVNPHAPAMEITHAVRGGGDAHLELILRRRNRESAGQITLLEGQRITGWRVSGADEPELWAEATDLRAGAEAAALPWRLAGGDRAWLFLDVDPLHRVDASTPATETSPAGDTGWSVHPVSERLKLTAFFNGRVVGRILPTHPGRTAGSPDRLWLPAPWWLPAGNVVALMAEAVGGEGTLSGFRAAR